MSRAQAAYELRVQGKTLAQVAETLGYDSIQDAATAIKEQFSLGAASLTDDERKFLLILEIDRLDRLQAAVWDAAMYGDPKAVDSALKIIGMRTKITGLDMIDSKGGQHTVLVIGGNQKNYVEQLKELVDD
jgi:hypothetical protein